MRFVLAICCIGIILAGCSDENNYITVDNHKCHHHNPKFREPVHHDHHEHCPDGEHVGCIGKGGNIDSTYIGDEVVHDIND